MCQQESIPADDEALGIIAIHTEGSARDAINLLERVRFAYKTVNKQAVLDLLRSVDDEHFIHLYRSILDKDLNSIITWLSRYASQEQSAHIIWDGFLELMRALIWRMNGITLERFGPHAQSLSALADRCTLKQLAAAMELFYQHELIFLKTTHQHRLFESLIMQLYENQSDHQHRKESPAVQQPTAPILVHRETVQSQTRQTFDDRWAQAVAQIEKLDDPLVSSLFKKGRFGGIEGGKILVHYAKDFIFFQDWLTNSQALWQPIMQKVFGDVGLEPQFTDESMPAAAPRSVPAVQAPVAVKREQPVPEKKMTGQVVGTTNQPRQQQYYQKKDTKKETLKPFDVSDKEQWKKAHLILSVFPGTISEVPQ
jgi:hypothetical protein